MDILKFDGEYRWLSNFWPAKITYEGIEYPTTEHAYQAAKTTDVNQRMIISKLPGPGKAKYYGKKLKIRGDWDTIKFGVMKIILREKFSIPELRDKLLSTGDSHLEEGNCWHDTIWGVDMVTKKGQNNLGRLLMEIRTELSQNK